jgi:hypothetical protein
MEYKYAMDRRDFSDLASGNVFYSLPGHPAFPVRLASEIYQRCLAWRGMGNSPCTIYDPCCGAAYHICVVAYLHWDSVCRVICSDVDEKAIQVAGRNLSLLTPEGMERRSREISAMLRLYNKVSHLDAQQSIIRMKEQVKRLTAIRPIQTRLFQANATSTAELRKGLQDTAIDIVFTDIPSGQNPPGQPTPEFNPVGSMLAALLEFLTPNSILAISSDKLQKIIYEKYQQLTSVHIGKRQIVFLRPA